MPWTLPRSSHTSECSAAVVIAEHKDANGTGKGQAEFMPILQGLLIRELKLEAFDR